MRPAIELSYGGSGATYLPLTRGTEPGKHPPQEQGIRGDRPPGGRLGVGGMFNPEGETGTRIAEAISSYLTYQPELTAPATQVYQAIRQMLGYDYADSIIRKVKVHIGIEQSRVYQHGHVDTA
jgi:hypothetical protein